MEENRLVIFEEPPSKNIFIEDDCKKQCTKNKQIYLDLLKQLPEFSLREKLKGMYTLRYKSYELSIKH